LQRLQDE